jgi:general secretion pathway protein M
MSAAIANLRGWWDGRTARERRMLAVMLALVAAVLVWLLVVRPAWGWRAGAAERLAEAQAEKVEVAAGLRALAPASARPARPANAEGLEPLVRRTAEAAGLTVDLGMDPDGGLGFRVSGARSAQVFGWLAVLEADHGVQVRSLGVVENADATLNVEGALAG